MNGHFLTPRETVLRLGLRDGMRVADFGAGSGHYARAVAAVVGPSGRVYAIDVQEDILKHLKLNTPEYHAAAIETIWGTIERPGGTRLKDASQDAVILANVLFQVEAPEAVVEEVARVLKPGGKVLIIDWTGSHGGMGPAPEQVVTETRALEFFTKEGFTKTSSVPAGSHHWGVILTRA